MTDRYKRQIILPEIGEVGQKKISNSSVLCIGAGGLGCPALLYLAGAGVGNIGVVDFDVVDETNLQRQILFTSDQVGQNKAEAAKERLSALNPDIHIQSYGRELTDENAYDLFKKYDVIIDGTDNFAAKFLINDAAIKAEKPLIYGSIAGFDGQVSVFGVANNPCYRCLYPETPKGHIPNCAEAGVIGAVAGIVGTTQAMEVIKIIVGHDSFTSLVGKLWTIDTRTMETQSLRLSKNSNCSVCSKEKEEIHLQYSSPVFGIISEVTPEQAKENKEALLVDVREISEWDRGAIDGAIHIPLSKLMENYNPDLLLNGDIILYCHLGKRSLKAVQILKSQGYLNVFSMAGGYERWLTLV